MNKLGISEDKVDEYIEKCEKQIKKEIEIKEAIERRGELYPGELKIALDNIESWNEMLELLENNK